MTNLNDIKVIGFTGNEPEMRFTPSGKAVATFSVAVNEIYTDGDGIRRESTEWFTIVCWNKLAEIVNQFVTKSLLIYVSGKVHLSTWKSQDGGNRSRMEIIAKQVIFLDRKDKDDSKDDGYIPEELGPEDIPF